MRIEKFSEYGYALDLSQSFLDSSSTIIESNTESKDFLQKIVNDLKLNTAIILSFGTGMELLIPIVKKLCDNGELKIDLGIETLTLMTVTAVTIAYLEEVKEQKQKSKLEKDAKSMLEELKMRGVGNGIIKKLVKTFMSIGWIAKLILKHKKNILTSFFEMLGYAALCVPVLNGIKAVVGDYNMTLDNFGKNMTSLLLGLSSLSSKHVMGLLTSVSKKDGNDTEIIDSSYDSGKEKLIKEQ